MRQAKIGSIVLASLLSILFVLSGCSTAAPSATSAPAATVAATTAAASTAAASATVAAPTANLDPVGKFDPPITLTTIRAIDPTRTYLPGETWDNNLWTKAIEERLGIKFNYLWSCASSEYDQKVNIAIASDELPDLLHIKYDQFYRLAVAGKLADITDAFNNYAGASLKSNMTDIANGAGLKMDQYNGKLYGIGDPPGYALSGNMLWFRNDWLANVGMSAPKTWDDVIKLMYAFAKNNPNKDGKPTVGLGVSKSLWNAGDDLSAFFAAYGANPTIWVQNGANLEFGAIQPQCKDALLELQKLYKDGVIDQEFSIKGDWDNYADDLVKDKVGLEFGPFWFGDWKVGDIMANHPNTATWTSMEVPAVSGGVAKRAVTGKQNMVLCMNSSAKNTEAMIKLINLGNALLSDPGTADSKFHDQKDASGNTVNTFFYFNDFLGGVGSNPDWNYVCAMAVSDAMKTGDTSKLNPEQMGYYTDAQSYLSGKDMKMYRRISVFGPDGSAIQWYNSFKAGNTLPDAYYGPNTDTMNAKLGNLLSKRDEYFVKIIMGDPIDEFDQWVSYFNAQGGTDITKEVNDWYAANK